MNNRHILHAKQLLTLLYEQQEALETEVVLTSGLAKTQAQQRLKQDIQPQIKKCQEDLKRYEEELWQLLAGQIKSLDIQEKEAEVVTAEIVEQLGQLETSTTRYPDESLKLWQEIRDQLNKPGVAAAAKLKGVISSTPPFFGISYEVELDTENFFRTHFPTFTALFEMVKKKWMTPPLRS